jgi:hypothetical protein
MTKIGLGICLAYLLSLGTSVADVTPGLQHAIRENTFEVVMKKPETLVRCGRQSLGYRDRQVAE